ncbi:MAG: GTP 3',8-cyclase MoaA [Firmicutes bacterium]|nr:GTP 3',8-cyclase MoaA [Bacillota bacterium]
MLDSSGRNIDYMRISITDRCNLRCRYCMPQEGIEKVSMSQILTFEEILRICGAAVSLGIRKFKVTGGEPLVRKGCTGLCAELKGIPGVEQVTMTTNGQLLAREIGALRQAGIDGINISLDSLREDRYRKITGGGSLEETLRGLDAAIQSGIPTKINCLLQQDFNEDELPDFARLAFERGIDVRFIEIMPIGFGRPETGISNETVLQRLEQLYPNLVRDERVHGNGPAVYYRLDGDAAMETKAVESVAAGSIGLISAMHASFCGSCNRIRLTSQGEVKPCLCYEDSISMKPALEDGSEDALRRALAEAIERKPAGHTFEDRGSVDRRAMMQIGG